MITNEVINKGIDYIIENIHKDISVSDVANYCNYSKYYFCRAFKEATGFSVYSYIKRLKMDYSAVRIMMDRDRSITDIGLQFGYSLSNYSTAFKKHHNVSPIEFRYISYSSYDLLPDSIKMKKQLKSFDDYDKRIGIQKMEDFTVIYERAFGSYMELGRYWSEFIYKYKDYIKEDTVMITRLYDNPLVTRLNQCMYDLCIIADENSRLSNKTSIKGGLFAVYHFDGMLQDIFITYHGLLHVWLLNSNYILDNGSFLNIYRSMVDIKKHGHIELCIPIKMSKNSEVN